MLLLSGGSRPGPERGEVPAQTVPTGPASAPEDGAGPAKLRGTACELPGPACPPAGHGRGVAAASGVGPESWEGGSPGSRLRGRVGAVGEAPEPQAAAPGLAASHGPPGGGRPGPGAGGWAAGAGCSPLPSSCVTRAVAGAAGAEQWDLAGTRPEQAQEGGSFLILGAGELRAAVGRAAPGPGPASSRARSCGPSGQPGHFAAPTPESPGPHTQPPGIHSPRPSEKLLAGPG